MTHKTLQDISLRCKWELKAQHSLHSWNKGSRVISQELPKPDMLPIDAEFCSGLATKYVIHCAYCLKDDTSIK
uniref:Uncharacterized protein n=1 Tax=Rhizophora mucronata TaxID=61149 RepID=A0A2P2NCD1_RHIMU